MDVGSAIPSLTTELLKKIEIDLPSLEEQKSITPILSAIDDKIENNLAINKTLEEMAMVLYKHWFVDFGPFQDGEFVESELGRIPKGWEVLCLDDVSTLTAGGDKPKNFSNVITYECKIPIYSNGITNDGLYGFTDTARINEESITVSARGTIGFVCLRQEPYLPIVRLIAVVPKKDFVTSKYLFYWLKTQNINGNGTTQQQLTVPDFKVTKVLVPKLEIINKFTDIINPYYVEINSNIKENQTLTQLRDTLLPKLISGEVRLKEFRE
jgi:type I restriction enzyme S subunit